jgi:hypothetical protein
MDLSRYVPIAREVEALVVEAAILKMSGPQFEISHRYCRDGVCMPGEEVASVALKHRGRRYRLRLSPSECLLFEALARNSRFTLNASQLAAYMQAEQFFRSHARNRGGSAFRRGISRKVIGVHVQRIRHAIDEVLASASIPSSGANILITERTAGPLGYRLRASSVTLHVDAARCSADVDEFVAGFSGAFRIALRPSTTYNQREDSKGVGSR